MPELPEVETLKRQLEPVLKGRTIERAQVLDPSVVAPVSPATFEKKVKGQTISEVNRRGKYLCCALASGLVLVIHLRMTGVLTHIDAPGDGVERRHLRLLFLLDDGSGLTFHDQRRFGKALLLSPEEEESYWEGRLGPEPLERSFNGAALKEILNSRKRPVKSLLLDQSLVAGIGNIYADESLFRARIHPLRLAAAVSEEEAGRLAKAIKETLRRAITLEGSSIDTYRTVRGGRGRFQDTFQVHRRVGDPCPGCGSTVEKIKVGGRGTYFCPGCQK